MNGRSGDALPTRPSPAQTSGARTDGTASGHHPGTDDPGAGPIPAGLGRLFRLQPSGASWLHSTAGSDGDGDASFGSSGRRAAGDTGNFAASRSPNGWPVRLSSARRDPGG